jgi:hypothetical protein
MLLTYLVLIQQASDGLKRFTDFLARTPCYSVDVSATSDNVKVPGKGTFLVKMPNSFRSQMNWGDQDYTYIKNPRGSIDYEQFDKTYQTYDAQPAIVFDQSTFSDIQVDSLPLPLIAGDLTKFLSGPGQFALTGHQSAGDTYTASWKAQSNGRVSATISPEGKLLTFEISVKGPTISIHRTMTFTNYVTNPPIPAGAFDITPPLGFTSFLLPYADLGFTIGEALHLGKWKTSSGSVNLDPLISSKLLIIREPSSLPADGLAGYLAKHRLPVKSMVLSLGTTGGDYNSPSPEIAAQLYKVGTPLMVLVGADRKVKAVWMGFDSDKPLDLSAAISAALREKGE